MCFIKSTERSQYSYKGPGDFFCFSGKSLKFCSRSILIFRGLTCDLFFKFCAFTLLNSTIEQQKCKVHEKRDRLLISKIENVYLISQRNKFYLLIHICQIGGNFSKKVSSLNCSTNSKSYWVIHFSSNFKIEVLKKSKSVFFCSFLAFNTLFQLSVSYVLCFVLLLF